MLEKQKQALRGVLKKRCSENLQIYSLQENTHAEVWFQ